MIHVEEEPEKEIDEDAEYQEMKKVNPLFTKEKYQDLIKGRTYTAIFKNKDYQEIIKNAKIPGFRNLDGAAAFCLDEGNEEKNRRWLNALAMNDMITIRQMVKEEVQLLAGPDGSVDDLPTVQQLSADVTEAGYRENAALLTKRAMKLRAFAKLEAINKKYTADANPRLLEYMRILVKEDEIRTDALKYMNGIDVSAPDFKVMKPVTGMRRRVTVEVQDVLHQEYLEMIRDYKKWLRITGI